MNKVLPFFMRHLALLLVILTFVLHGLHAWRIPYLDRLDAWIYDARLTANAPRTFDPHVVIVDIDEPSLAAFGRWPWARDTTAALVKRLGDEQQAAAIGFDMVFAEEENTRTDLALARALENQPAVLGYYFTSDRAGHTTGTLPAPAFAPNAGGDRDFQITQWSGFGANLAKLTEVASQSGFFNAISDMDGVIRTAPLLAEFQGQYYESLALALYRRYLASQTPNHTLPTIEPHFASNDSSYRHLDALRLRYGATTQDVAVDNAVIKLIPYRGPGGPRGGSFTYISAADVLQGKLPAASLKDKVVLIGSSAPALEDLRVTPFDTAYPGVEVQANLVAGLIDGRSPTQPDYALGFDVFQLLLLSLILLALLPSLSALGAVALCVILTTSLWFAHYLLFTKSSLVLPSASSFALVFSTFTLRVSQGFFIEGQRRKRLTQLFGSYVSPKWVSRMVHSGNDYSMQANNQTLTVMFCDMRGFTRLSQDLPPLALQALLNDIFNRLSHIIQAHGGTIDKYMGDCVMAFWGAPEPQADHAARAVHCAVELQTEIDSFNQLRTVNTPEIKMGIGINTGLMCVGDMGSSIRRSYTVIGESVNLAARLEGLCKTYNQRFIVSAATKDSAVHHSKNILWQDLGLATVAGSDQPIHIFTIQTQLTTI
jgi:adenylate cyclase